MDINYIQKLSLSDRKELLEGDAIEIIKDTLYTKPLTPEEVAFYKSELSENAILKAELEEEKTQLLNALKEKLKPVGQKISTSLKAIKYKAIECHGTLYRIADFDEQKVHTIDADGNLINTRAMLPSERQFRIQAVKQQSAS